MSTESQKRQILNALADQGRALGMEAAAEVILEVVKTHNRVVGTNTLRDVAAALKDHARRIRSGADGAIAHLKDTTSI